MLNRKLMAAVSDHSQGLGSLGDHPDLIEPACHFQDLFRVAFQDDIGAKYFEEAVIRITATDNMILVGGYGRKSENQEGNC